MKHDVIVIGGGHAGCEAACAVARMGVEVLLITQRIEKIGEMSCNPAIGGLGKGHLVREIDALDGLMGRAADSAGIQFRLLNRGKGPAVRGPRAQCDRRLYRENIQKAVLGHPLLNVVEGEVIDLAVCGSRVTGVHLVDGTLLGARAVVLTTGTFLGGVIHIGQETRPGGRIGEHPSSRLAARLRDLGLPLARLKTGTPPRLDGRSINYEVLEEQPGDEDPEFFSFWGTVEQAPQLSCHIAMTNERTHEIISEKIHLSAMYSGRITGVGPRYCPSIEDKIARFPDKSSHQIFLEPEGLSTPIVYPNGISTSLPLDVQNQYVRSIKGLENAEITQPGYAIEYDYLDPKSLTNCLKLKILDGIYLAGQINGTTGYEEAAGQGLVAGLNAACAVRERAPFVLSRSQGYLGVMIDDLVTQGVSEPYRMFTSRAEFRLSLRADNADQRLTGIGIELNCVNPGRAEEFHRKMERLRRARDLTETLSMTPTAGRALGLEVKLDGVRRTALELLSLPGIDFATLGTIWPELTTIDPATARQLENDAAYASFIERQNAEAANLRAEDARPLPSDLDYQSISGLSAELRRKLTDVAPATLGQAARIEGMTPAALALILVLSKRPAGSRRA